MQGIYISKGDTKNRGDNIRRIILKGLVGFFKKNQYSDAALNNILSARDYDPRDAGFITRVFYGVIEKKLYIDHILAFLIEKNIQSLDGYVLNILRIGVYELEFMDSVPPNATCNECVEVIKSYNKKAAGFVNAVLRNFIRRSDAIHAEIEALPLEDRLSVKYSVPVPLVRMWSEQYGAEVCEALLAESANLPALTITANALKISADALAERFAAKGIECERITDAPYGIRLLRDVPVIKTQEYEEGLFFVQDGASQLCASELEAKSGGVIIDMCAAPGGKSFYAALDMENKGKILAFDLHENKVKRINEGAERLGIGIISAERGDSSVLREELTGSADGVLCDAPCSGFGVLNKKPEIKYRDHGDFKERTDLQYSLLTTASRYVKDGGILVYSTCTLNKKENEEITDRFLHENSSFKPGKFANDFPDAKGIKTFFPHKEKIDGFFLVKMIRYGV